MGCKLRSTCASPLAAAKRAMREAGRKEALTSAFGGDAGGPGPCALRQSNLSETAPVVVRPGTGPPWHTVLRGDDTDGVRPDRPCGVHGARYRGHLRLLRACPRPACGDLRRWAARSSGGAVQDQPAPTGARIRTESPPPWPWDARYLPGDHHSRA